MAATATRKKTTRPRTRAVQQRAVDTQRRILDAAIKEFAEHGYVKASTRSVAKEAGVQHGLVGYHFSGKEGLWRAVIRDLLAANRARFEAHLQEYAHADAVTRLRALQEDIFDVSPARMDFHRIMAHVSRSRGRQLKWIVDEYFRSVYDVRAGLIRAAQKSGSYVAGDPYHLQYLLLGAMLMPYVLAPEFEEVTGRSVESEAFLAEHRRLCLSLFFRDGTE